MASGGGDPGDLSATLGLRWDDLRRRADELPMAPSETIRGTEPTPLMMPALHALEPKDAHRFVLGEPFAKGGMGAVHAGRQVALDREVAIKRPLDRRAGSVGVQQKLLQEAWIAGALEHPNILPIYDIEVAARDEPRIVMKRIRGEPWSEQLADPRPAAREGLDLLEWNLRVLLAVTDAVRYAHAHGIVHLDIKPENVMIGAFGEVYLLDWGVARALQPDPVGRFPLVGEIEELVGTPAYMSPEQVACNGRFVTERTDVYLLGATLFEILSGAPPHGAEGDVMAALYRAAGEPPDPPATAPSALASICARSLAADPEDRFASVEAFRLALDDFLQHREAHALLETGQEQVAAIEALVQQAEPDEEAIDHAFLEARFALRQALAVWPEAEPPRIALSQLGTLMATHQLDCGRPERAAGIARDLPVAPEVATRIEAASAERTERLRELRQLRDDLDLEPGTGGRLLLFGIMALVGALLPMWRAQHMDRVDWTIELVTPLVLVGIALGAGWYVRDALRRTRINRQLFALLMLALVMQAVVTGIDAYNQVTLGFHASVLFATWGGAAWAGIALAEPRLWPAGVAYVAAAVFVSWLPETRYPVMSAVNIILMLNVSWIWGPWGKREATT